MLYAICVVIRTHDGPKISCIPVCLHTAFGSDYYVMSPVTIARKTTPMVDGRLTVALSVLCIVLETAPVAL